MLGVAFPLKLNVIKFKDNLLLLVHPLTVIFWGH